MMDFKEVFISLHLSDESQVKYHIVIWEGIDCESELINYIFFGFTNFIWFMSWMSLSFAKNLLGAGGLRVYFVDLRGGCYVFRRIR